MGTLYTINGQQPITRSVPGVGFVPTYEVTFTAHPSEQLGKVDVPASDYTPAVVDAAITPVAQALNAIQAL